MGKWDGITSKTALGRGGRGKIGFLDNSGRALSDNFGQTELGMTQREGDFGKNGIHIAPAAVQRRYSGVWREVF
jgi:hypothetical protein